MGQAAAVNSPRGDGPTLCPLAPLALVGLGLLQAAALLAWLAPPWTASLPLGLLLLLAGLAPFFPRWRLLLPALDRGRCPDGVALTFDDGPDPATTPALLQLLARRGARAAFFVVGARVRAHPELVRAMLEAGHELGNHSDDHDPLLMLRGRARLGRSIQGCQAALAPLGVRPALFRPPAWVVNPRLWRALLEADLVCAVARRRALDFGNRRLPGLAARLLRRVRPGDVLALHDRAPPGGGGPERWLAEVERLLDGLAARGLRAAALSEVLGRPVHEPLPAAGAGPVRRFYDALARDYDAEQATAGQQGLRAAERDAVLARLPGLLPTGGERVLEVGAGTGRFTLELLRRAREVCAVDLSPRMLAELEAKARAAGLGHLRAVCAGLHAAPLTGPFELVAAYSALEYLPGLEAALVRLAGLLGPGGCLHLTTAHRSLPRLFTQLGNAMRQGVWLHARSRGRLGRAARAAGLEIVRLEAFGLRLPGLPGFGGLMLELVARKPGQGGAAPGPEVRAKDRT
jgi:peptidoglycan-N-acetylglucosamine deacetylase